VKPHVDEIEWTRFQAFLALKTRDEVQVFSSWVFSLNIKPITGMRSLGMLADGLNTLSVVEPQTQPQMAPSWAA
jgi:hypothetical protein